MKTTYQKTHKPSKRIEIKCQGEFVDNICSSCGRILKNNRLNHNPNIKGFFGYIEEYSDGSYYNTRTKKAFSSKEYSENIFYKE